MAILSAKQLEKQIDEARKQSIRQDVKSHCTKIRDGIKKNGANSAVRAIWELFQNACDLSSNAEVRIVLTSNELIFAHKGKPFTYDSLCSLIKQVSSKEKEDSDATGQFGTGFLTTHIFSRKILLKGSMQISSLPEAYVDLQTEEQGYISDGLLINREHFDDIPLFIDDLTQQICSVENLYNFEQKSQPKEWTELHYLLDETGLNKAKQAIEETKKVLPYVLTFNDKLSSCTISDEYGQQVFYTKYDESTNIIELCCKKITIISHEKRHNHYCYYLQLHEGDSRIILPINEQNEVCSYKGIPKFFICYPLIGPNYFDVNFLFHSRRFIPEEARDNIIVPRDNEALKSAIDNNEIVLREMTHYLWDFLKCNVTLWHKTVNLASIDIQIDNFDDVQTQTFYSLQKQNWVETFMQLKLFEIGAERYSLKENGHPYVIDKNLIRQIMDVNGETIEQRLTILYPYAHNAAPIPKRDELLQWSRIVENWGISQENYCLTAENIVANIHETRQEYLLEFLTFVATFEENRSLFDKYALLPNRKGILKHRNELCDAKCISEQLYNLVYNLDERICEKYVDVNYAQILPLTLYTLNDLRTDLNESVSQKERELWRETECPSPYDGKYECALMELCSVFSSEGEDSKRSKIMPLIYKFEDKDFQKHIISLQNDGNKIDIHRQIFLSLVQNQMMKIEKHDKAWVLEYFNLLRDFVENARGDDYKNFCTRYAIYPDLNYCLHTPDSLKNAIGVREELFDLYYKVMGEDLKHKCVHDDFSPYYVPYNERINQYDEQKVAHEIQNKLSDNQFRDPIVLDIIELTEGETDENKHWQNVFNTIYTQRESIRYHLGTPEEHRAINRLMKQKQPQLLERMANIVEAGNVMDILAEIDSRLKQERDAEQQFAFVYAIGKKIEEELQNEINDEFANISVNIETRNQQNGQDIVIYVQDKPIFYIECKAKWNFHTEPAHMSSAQIKQAVKCSDKYALLCVDCTGSTGAKIPIDATKEQIHNSIHDILNHTYAHLDIGKLLAPTIEAQLKHENDGTIDNEQAIRIYSTLSCDIPKSVFNSGEAFDSFIQSLKMRIKNECT